MNVPKNSLALPVLIVLGKNPSGSGFFVTNSKGQYLVTAKHVLFNDSRLKSSSCELFCPTSIDDDVRKYSINLKSLHKDGNLLNHPSKDLTIIKVGKVLKRQGETYSISVVPGAKVKKRSKANVVGAIVERISKLEDCEVASDIYLYGYPSSLGLKHSPQFDYKKPLLRKGIIANINKKEGTLILDCPVYYGNSGGPVIHVFMKDGHRYYRTVAVVSQFIPYSERWVNQSNALTHIEVYNSGYSVAIAMDYVLELLDLFNDS